MIHYRKRLAKALLGVSMLGVGLEKAQAQFDALNGEPIPYLQPIITGPNGTAGVPVGTSALDAYGRSTASGAGIVVDAKALSGGDAQKQYESTLSVVEGVLDAQRITQNKMQADASNTDGVNIDPSITHQPLIHIKVRVIEVQRSDSLAVSSILDFITGNEAGTTGFGNISDSVVGPFNQGINTDLKRFAGITRLPINGLADAAGGGAGMLVNLTSGDVDYLVRLLATEVNADTVTAPQVTTLNGKSVQFRAGSFVPFALGRNTIVNGVNSTTEVFYRHVGSFIEVTPQIVNWDNIHRGLGKARLAYASTEEEFKLVTAEEVSDDEVIMAIKALFNSDLSQSLSAADQSILSKHANDPPYKDTEISDAKAWLVSAYNSLLEAGISRQAFSRDVMPGSAIDKSVSKAVSCGPCAWKASDCTINLNLQVRVSDDPQLAAATGDTNVVPTRTNSETNVRAIQNCVQLKSGRGVVLGGLISMQDAETVQKVPFLGDIPIVGAAFRSTDTQLIKTETLIFLEAEVLPGFDDCQEGCESGAVEEITSRDFQLGKTHTYGAVTDSPLNQGMHRAGLRGEYLPLPTRSEEKYWQQYYGEQRHLRQHRISNQSQRVFR